MLECPVHMCVGQISIDRYLTPTMLRQLLTLLAVISGFTLSASPVHATQASVVAVTQAAERADCVVQGTRPIQLADMAAFGAIRRQPCERPVMVVQVPTVMLRVDRSRE